MDMVETGFLTYFSHFDLVRTFFQNHILIDATRHTPFRTAICIESLKITVVNVRLAILGLFACFGALNLLSIFR